MTLILKHGPGHVRSQTWDGLVVIASGVSWDDIQMSEKNLAIHLAAHAPILFVDPPMSWLTPLRKPQLRRTLSEPRLRVVAPNIARLTPLAPPGISRPVLRQAAMAATRLAIKSAARRLTPRVRALVVCSLDPLLKACPAEISAVYGTDDWVAGSELMKISADWLRKRENAQLADADIVIAVSQTLADRWSSRAMQIHVIPNGCDAGLFARSDDVEAAPDITLPDPIAGFIGHLSERIDIDCLTEVAETGHSLLLVGPRQLTFDLEKVDRLLTRPNVQWTGPRSFDQLPSYLNRIKVGLTPYRDTAFNRSSYPLKTLEYLAAGRAAVVTDLPASRTLPKELVTLCDGSAQFAAATVGELERPADPALAGRRRDFGSQHSWAARAADFARVLGL